MAYYLGRDVKVYLTTESPDAQVDVASNAISAISAGGLSTSATATFTFGDTEFDDDDEETITLIDAAGLSRTYLISNDYGASGALQFNAGANATAAAANFKAVVEASGGHDGTITVAVVAGAVTMTQATTGTAGNTTISHSSGWDAICDVNVGAKFTGGVSDPTGSGTAGNFAENLVYHANLSRVADLTAVDLGIGVTDEDITYMGSKTVLKAEIKKETTISLTRKKSDNVWDVIYNGKTAANEGWTGSAAEEGDYGARWGVIEGTEDDWYINNGLLAPKDAVDYGTTVPCFGYRVHLVLNSGECISIPACQLTGHTVSLNADGTTEETCELVSQVTPLIGAALSDNFSRLVAGSM